MAVDVVKVEIQESETRSYPIVIGENALDSLGKLIKQNSKAKKFLVVTNKTVSPLYGQKVKESLEKEGFITEFIILEDGERFKNINSLESIWDEAIKNKIERKDGILALGGGVVGDIAGFAAATYLRGVDFIQVTTTLLAQVDSSVGGKVAINHKSGKNLLGAFYQPKLVLTDTSTLKTLSVDELKVGLAEILKYGFIEKSCGLKGSKFDFINFLTLNKDEIFSLDSDITKKLIKHCCELKAAVVNQDERESGLRAILNFGHTIGHAVEKCSNYEGFNHGQAVAVGMRGALYIAKEKNLIDNNYFNEALSLIKLYGLDYKIPVSIQKEDLLDAMLLDKKVLSNKIRFILPVNRAKVEIFSDVDRNVILSAIEKLYLP
jgi:3-dehydroquinate synthase